MKIAGALLLGILSLNAQDLSLSEGDRQALIDRLQEVRAAGSEREAARKGDAYSAFTSAVTDDKATFELWVKCSQKVRFTDQKRDNQAFREWKRGAGERFDSDSFHRAARHQLSWLILAIEASRADNSHEAAVALSTKAVSRIEAILADEEILKEGVASGGRGGKRAYQVVEENAFRTQFARAYEVTAPEGWPKSPLEIKEVYQAVILPPYFKSQDYENYRKAWNKMILQLGTFTEMKGREADTGGKSAAFEKFVENARPDLRWELEKNIFEMGNEKEAAKNMIGLLEEYSGHRKELAWAKEFEDLLAGGN